MKKNYNSPIAEKITFATQDVITFSINSIDNWVEDAFGTLDKGE